MHSHGGRTVNQQSPNNFFRPIRMAGNELRCVFGEGCGAPCWSTKGGFFQFGGASLLGPFLACRSRLGYMYRKNRRRRLFPHRIIKERSARPISTPPPRGERRNAIRKEIVARNILPPRAGDGQAQELSHGGFLPPLNSIVGSQRTPRAQRIPTSLAGDMVQVVRDSFDDKWGRARPIT